MGRIGEEQPDGWAYHLGDALSSVRQLVDSSGFVVLARAYEPFGNILSSAGYGNSVYGFVGEQVDATGLVYMRARYLDPRQGRFITRDVVPGSLFHPGTLNLYTYVTDNPVTFVDPDGTFRRRGEHCEEWREEIEKLIERMLGHADSIIKNPRNLPLRGPFSVGTHQKEYRQMQNELNDLLGKWDRRGCGDPPTGARGLASAPAPNVGQNDYLDLYRFCSPEMVEAGANAAFWSSVTAVLVYIIYNSKGCLAGPAGCILDWVTPFP